MRPRLLLLIPTVCLSQQTIYEHTKPIFAAAKPNGQPQQYVVKWSGVISDAATAPVFDPQQTRVSNYSPCKDASAAHLIRRLYVSNPEGTLVEQKNLTMVYQLAPHNAKQPQATGSPCFDASAWSEDSGLSRLIKQAMQEAQKKDEGRIRAVLAADLSEILEFTFRRGNVDQNIIGFYVELEKAGRLPTRRVRVETPALGLELVLLRENIVFKNYLPALNLLLARLNRNNVSGLRFFARRKDSPVLDGFECRTPCEIVLPAVEFAEYEFVESIELDGRPLAKEAFLQNLYRPYNRVADANLALREDETAKAKLTRLNRGLGLNADEMLAASKGRFLFPGEGFRCVVPMTRRTLSRMTKNPNVFIGVTRPKAVTKAFANAPPGNAPPGPNDCGDPREAEIVRHRARISYILPKILADRERTSPIVSVIDKFPLTITDNARNERTYLEKAAEYFFNDNELSELEKEALRQESVKWGITVSRAAELEQSLVDGGSSPLQYPLSFHPEFSRDPGQQQNAPDEYLENEDHGFHVAALVAARCNGYGMTGMLPFGRVAAYNLNEISNPRQAVLDILNSFSCSNRPCIVNASWTYRSGEVPEFEAELKNLKKHLLVVAAAGEPKGPSTGQSLGSSCDLIPACLGTQGNVITVTAAMHDPPTLLHPLANFNAETERKVSLAAPGDKIISAIRPGGFRELSGTSQATAFVTGAAAMLQLILPNLSAPQIKSRLLYTADLDMNYGDKVYFGRLNVARAITHPADDVVYLAKSPLIGYFDFTRPASKNAKRELFLYRRGRAFDKIGDCRISAVRRIFLNPSGRYYTVVYESTSDGRLTVARDVSFYPDGAPIQQWEDRLTTSFRLHTCANQADLADEGVDIEERVRRCGGADTPRNIDLRQVQDMVIRSGVSMSEGH